MAIERQGSHSAEQGQRHVTIREQGAQGISAQLDRGGAPTLETVTAP